MLVISGIFQEEDAVQKISIINNLTVSDVKFIESNFNPEPLKKVVLELARLNNLESIQIKVVPERFIRLITDHIANKQTLRHLTLNNIPISALSCLSKFIQELAKIDTLELLEVNQINISEKFKNFVRAIAEIETLKVFRFSTHNQAMITFVESCFTDKQKVKLSIVPLANTQKPSPEKLSNFVSNLKRKYNFIDNNAEVYLTKYKLSGDVTVRNNKENLSPTADATFSASKKQCTLDLRRQQSRPVLYQHNFFPPLILTTLVMPQSVSQRNNNQPEKNSFLLPHINEMLNGDLTKNSLNHLIKPKLSF